VCVGGSGERVQGSGFRVQGSDAGSGFSVQMGIRGIMGSMGSGDPIILITPISPIPAFSLVSKLQLQIEMKTLNASPEP
jgi:hypothetical protein